MDKTTSKRPIVISFLQEKGGAGKTTLSTNIASCFALLGYKTLLVDSDPQGSARNWSDAYSDPFMRADLPVIGMDRETIARDLYQISKPFDIVIIDGAPGITKITSATIKVSDIVFIPIQPSQYDLWATQDLVELIKARQDVTNGKPKAAFITSRVIKNTLLSKEINATLAEYDLPILTNYTTQQVAYPTSASLGISVVNYPARWSTASNEITRLMQEIKEKYIDGFNYEKD